MQVHLILAFVAFLWGLNPPAMKIGLLYVDPMPYNAIRMLVALVVGWGVLRRMASWQPLRREDWKVLLISSLGFFFFQLFFTAGVQMTTAGNASLILGCLPVSVAIINHFHRLERISVMVMVGILISIAGVVIMVAGTGKEISLSEGHIIGTLILLAAQMSYGYYTVFSRLLIHGYSAYQITAYILLISTGLFLIVSLPSVLATDWQSVPWAGWISILYSGLFPLCLGNCLWIWGTGILGSTKASLYNNLPPVFAVAIGYLFLGESFGWLQFMGAVIIFAGLYIAKGRGIKPTTKKGISNCSN
ncbi:DMT family transporter [Pelosinus sp. sgz500959]|uniref:DMT family transporter n=1 Tax=Pelosinus sp. sgz500959 TaxID=3242472 RepID=UPI00367181E1